MDFFEAQDSARRKTGVLVALFAGAVISLVLLTNGAVAAAVVLGSEGRWSLATLPNELWLTISAGVVLVILVGSGVQALRLRAGGASVAIALGGEPVSADSKDPLERRAQNLVEEMALAAGIPVPPLYIIPEASINAFAAGFQMKDAVIGLNRGTLEALSRDELQGVIAHEFSHIVHGDMGLNLRLMALLHGILMVSVAGRVLMHSRGGYGRRRNDAAQVIALGAALMVIGYCGVFFGRLIKASISRQREFLADAAAVQFTRNPEGIGQALQRIGGAQQGSHMTDERAEESSHLFFGPIRAFSSLFRTHPPLEARIRAVLPAWDGAFLPPLSQGPAAAEPVPSGAPTSSPRTSLAALGATLVLRELAGQADLPAAQARLATLDEGLRDALHTPAEAWSLALALRSGALAHETLALPESPAARFTVLQLALPTLRAQSTQTLLAQEEILEQASAPPKQFLCWLVDEALRQLFQDTLRGPRRSPGTAMRLLDAEDALQVLFRCLAAVGGGDGEQQRRAIAAGRRQLDLPPLPETASLSPGDTFALPDDLTEADFDRAVAKLRTFKPQALAQVLQAFVKVIDDDGVLTEGEYALLQGLALLLDCPLPPRFDRP